MSEPRQLLSRIPMFESVDRDAIEIERLGGLTNLVHRVRVDGVDYLLRIAGKGTEDYIDRANERRDAEAAARAGVSATVLFFDETDGLMLASWLDGDTLNAERYRQPGRVERSADALRRLHTSGEVFGKRFDVFEQIDEYLALVEKLNASVPDGYAEVRREAAGVRKVLEAHPAPLAPCHCDPLAENFIDDGGRVAIVDWEYAGNNDPMWDLGDLSVEAGFDADQDERLLGTYFQGDVPADRYGRMVAYKMLCDLLWTLWGVVQHANGNQAEDFWSYSVNRFERCRKLLQDPGFANAVAAIGR